MKELKSGKYFFILLAGFHFIILTGCKKVLNLKEPGSDNFSVFNEAWTAIDKHYALFEIKGINWNSIYDQYHSQVTNNITDKELFIEIGNMFQTLKDGHVSLITSIDTSTYDGFYTTFPSDFNFKNIVTNYLKNDYKTSGPLVYKVENNIGYIYYSSFEKDITDEQLDVVMNEMIATKGLIIDVRNNQGGKSKNADGLFKRFISQKRLVKFELIKKGPGHSDFLDPQPYYINAGNNYYKNPVCVLVNRSCFSACNDFILYMSGLTNVQLIGDQSGGGGGIPYNYILANGWKIQYTGTVTLSPEKTSIENGIAPDVPVVITPIDEANGKDPILEKAIELLQ